MTTGFCECGCGQQTKLAKQTHSKYGWVKGQPFRFVVGHSVRTVSADRYPARAGGRIHRLRAEAALGKPLARCHPVHHVDGTKSLSSALVICQDTKYHRLLHTRTRVLKAGGNPNTDRICCDCRRVLPLTSFSPSANQCRECNKARLADYRNDPEFVERRRVYEQTRRTRRAS